jgi:F-type H+-transporting ATPase subunit gamma
MSNTKAIRQRIKGVQNTAKITRAMEMIASSKMRKAQERGLAGRPYSVKIKQVIADLAVLSRVHGDIHPLLQQRPVKRALVVHITPDRGMVGGMDANVNRKTASFILKQKIDVSLLLVGRRGIDFMRRYQREIKAEFSKLGDKPSLIETLPISHIIIDEYTRGSVDMVYVAYAGYTNVMKQTPVIEQILPVVPEKSDGLHNYDYIFEPGIDAVLGRLLPRFVESEIYHIILESLASEQSARMVAMRNATQSANELTEALTLAYYKARQESITSELLDIVSGSSAIA